MEEILKELGLKPDATQAQTLAAIIALKEQIKTLSAPRSRVPRGLDPAKVEARRRAGLTLDEAIQAEQNQVEADEAKKKAEKK